MKIYKTGTLSFSPQLPPSSLSQSSVHS